MWKNSAANDFSEQCNTQQKKELLVKGKTFSKWLKNRHKTAKIATQFSHSWTNKMHFSRVVYNYPTHIYVHLTALWCSNPQRENAIQLNWDENFHSLEKVTTLEIATWTADVSLRFMSEFCGFSKICLTASKDTHWKCPSPPFLVQNWIISLTQQLHTWWLCHCRAAKILVYFHTHTKHFIAPHSNCEIFLATSGESSWKILC